MGKSCWRARLASSNFSLYKSSFPIFKLLSNFILQCYRLQTQGSSTFFFPALFISGILLNLWWVGQVTRSCKGPICKLTKIIPTVLVVYCESDQGMVSQRPYIQNMLVPNTFSLSLFLFPSFLPSYSCSSISRHYSLTLTLDSGTYNALSLSSYNVFKLNLLLTCF